MSAGPVLLGDPHFRRRLVSPEASGRCGVRGSGLKRAALAGLAPKTELGNEPHGPQGTRNERLGRYGHRWPSG
jgi:hypothetical protein